MAGAAMRLTQRGALDSSAVPLLCSSPPGLSFAKRRKDGQVGPKKSGAQQHLKDYYSFLGTRITVVAT